MTSDFNTAPQVLVSNLAQVKPVHWLQVQLIGSTSNRDGLGAVVKVETARGASVKLHDGKSGYLSQSSLPLYFGLGDDAAVPRVDVRWPSGKTQVITQDILLAKAAGAIIIGIVIGLANALVVVKLKVDSFIGTLGMSSILAAVAYMISGGGQEVLPEEGYYPFLNFVRTQWFGISASVYYAAVLAIIIWWILEYPPGGRYLYAVGGNPTAARLAGVKVGRIVMLSFVASAVVASFAGIVYLAQNANAAEAISLGMKGSVRRAGSSFINYVFRRSYASTAWHCDGHQTKRTISLNIATAISVIRIPSPAR